MLDAQRRPMGRFFYCLLSILLAWAVAPTPLRAATAPTTTRVNDVVFRAEGTPASGTVLISWPAFTTAGGAPVAAGRQERVAGQRRRAGRRPGSQQRSGPGGNLLQGGISARGRGADRVLVSGRESPTTIGAVRATPGSGTASQGVSRQYVDSAVAAKASDTSVVHLGGAETIAGTKLFSVSPSVPVPGASTDAVNKAYVDAAVASVGAGSFVSKNGDARVGPLSLPGDVASTNGINLPLDAQFVVDLEALIAAVEQYAKVSGIPKPATK